MSERFKLNDVEDVLPESLPLGIRQRLSLAVAVIHRPEMLILEMCIRDSVKAAIERHGDGSPNFGVKMMPNVQTSLLYPRIQYLHP